MDKVITKITYNGQELSIYIPQLNIDPYKFFSYSETTSKFIDSTGFYTSIRPATFNHQDALRSVYLPKLMQWEPKLFANCSNLSDLTIPNASVIPARIFSNCYNLTFDFFDFDKIVKIENNGLDYTKISQAIFPNCLEIGNAAFSVCRSLTEVYLPKCSIIGGSAFDTCTALQSISLPNLSIIPSYCFKGCSMLEQINIPKCTEIGYGAFSGCINLTELSFDNVSRINPYAFSGCTKLSKLTFTRKASYFFGDYGQAFSGATNLKELICNTTTWSSVPTFYFPSATIERVIMPYLTSFTSASDFRGFPKLKEVNFDSLQSFHSSNYLFLGCSALEKISLPQISNLGSSAFKNCYALSQAVFAYPSVVKLGNASCFQNTPIANSSYLGYYGSVYVPARLVSQYQSATNWVQYSERITSIDNLPSGV